jgi:hypothetical protein
LAVSLIKKEKNMYSIGCVAHLIQLAIRDSFKDNSVMSDLLAKCQTIIKHFKKSGPSMRILEEIQRSLKLSHLKLLQNVKTRWNSDYYMVSS